MYAPSQWIFMDTKTFCQVLSTLSHQKPPTLAPPSNSIVRGWRALYRWSVRSWNWFCTRHDHANAIELDELAAAMRQIHLRQQYSARWGLLDWLDETTTQPEDLV
ncbi:hypothetical protein N7448_010532 [Penicillium atrosanguineum]|uniref:Uncharacterized protein n=1 Tax=Penicillium atrosanguineum TaxID=1132637 RepID=A0A9W9GGA6_9EURO|nr:hypothetical protein N7448_010532 [Penicillium atrosanguineum]KAJ5299624.1 hypothetical protein N7476_011181 [Penicillium atrosanguineum]